MNKDKTVIELSEHSLDYMRQTDTKVKKIKGYLIFIITSFITLVSIIFFILQTSDYEFIEQLNIFKRIKNNMVSWKSLILEKTGIEIAKGQNLSTRVDAKAFNFNCYDFGTYFVAAKLSEKNNLPEFIKRGNGDVWMIKKAGKRDESSNQFCEFIIRNNTLNTIQCGIDMYNKVGYSGYFESLHPCQTILDEIQEKFRL